MVQFNEETARKNITISEKTFSIPQPFAEGHVCSANEASVLNQILAENCRNNFAPKVKKEPELATQEAFDKYVATYQFGVRSVSSSDPVQKLMREIVENALVKSLAAQGMTKASMPKEAFENQIQATIEEKYDALFERATKILALKNEGLN
jgi:hypothetical protein